MSQQPGGNGVPIGSQPRDSQETVTFNNLPSLPGRNANGTQIPAFFLPLGAVPMPLSQPIIMLSQEAGHGASPEKKKVNERGSPWKKGGGEKRKEGIKYDGTQAQGGPAIVHYAMPPNGIALPPAERNALDMMQGLYGGNPPHPSNGFMPASMFAHIMAGGPRPPTSVPSGPPSAEVDAAKGLLSYKKSHRPKKPGAQKPAERRRNLLCRSRAIIGAGRVSPLAGDVSKAGSDLVTKELASIWGEAVDPEIWRDWDLKEGVDAAFAKIFSWVLEREVKEEEAAEVVPKPKPNVTEAGKKKYTSRHGRSYHRCEEALVSLGLYPDKWHFPLTRENVTKFNRADGPDVFRPKPFPGNMKNGVHILTPENTEEGEKWPKRAKGEEHDVSELNDMQKVQKVLELLDNLRSPHGITDLASRNRLDQANVLLLEVKARLTPS